MTKYGISPWLDQFPKSRVPSYPAHRGPLKASAGSGAHIVDAVIVGGGLTGCVTAYALAVAGASTVLLEQQRIGRGSTASSTGWIADDPGVAYATLDRALGRRDARRAWQSWRRAALDFATLVRRLDIRCGLEARPSVTVATSADQLAWLKKEQKARLEAGLEAPFLTSRAVRAETALEVAGGLRGRDGGTLDHIGRAWVSPGPRPNVALRCSSAHRSGASRSRGSTPTCTRPGAPFARDAS